MKSPSLIGLALVSAVLLVAVLIQASTISNLNEENKTLSDKILVLEEELKASQQALSTLQEKEPNVLESLIGSMKKLVGKTEENTEGTTPQSDNSRNSVEETSNTTNYPN